MAKGFAYLLIWTKLKAEHMPVNCGSNPFTELLPRCVGNYGRQTLEHVTDEKRWRVAGWATEENLRPAKRALKR